MKIKKFIYKYRTNIMILFSILLFILISQTKYGLIISILLLSGIIGIVVYYKKTNTQQENIALKPKKQNKITKKQGKKKKKSPNKNNKTNKKEQTQKKSKSQTKGKKSGKKFNKSTPKKKTGKKVFRIFIILLLTSILFSLLGSVYFLYLVVAGAPEFNEDHLYKTEASIFYDSDGEEITRIGSEIREIVTYDDLPEVLIDAIIATEDARFFQHNGFDLPRFIRASTGQVMGDSLAGGGSTLTMQLSKNLFTSSVASGFDGIVRKFTDIYVSVYNIERNFTKYEIIEFYANSHFLGAGAYGVEQASQTYFGKSARDLNLSEAALISGLFNAPSALNPYVNPQGAETRRNVVLGLMERHGYITNEERKIAASISVPSLLTERSADTAKYMGFINTVTEEVEKKTGHNPYVVPMDIYTTMNREKQDHMEEVFNGEIFEWENEVIQGGAAAVDVETGAIVAIGAGRNHTNRRGFNFATMIKRHIGSASKPLFSYGPAFEHLNWSTYQPIVDEPVSYTGGSNVRNWDRGYDGFITTRDALRRSRNTTALKTFQTVSNRDILEFSRNLGLSPEVDGNTLHEAHSLGGYNGESPLSMAAAYAAFANGGYYIEPYSFTKIVYKDSGEEFTPPIMRRERVMSEESAYMVMNVLVDAGRYGLGRYSNVNNRVYGAKTGTSNFTAETKRRFGLSASAINDLWVSGTSPQYALALWYGYEKIDPEHYTRFGNRRHTHLYQTIARGIFEDGASFSRPSGVNSIAIEKDTYPARLPSPHTPENMIITELFKDGTEPVEVSTRFSQLLAPTNLTFTEEGNNLKISWNPITTPLYYDLERLTANYKPIFRNENYLKSFIIKITNQTKERLGEFGYNVYRVNGDSEELIGFTTDNNYIVNRFNYANQTIAVRAAYSKQTDNQSEAITKKYEGMNIEATFNLQETRNLFQGEFYQLPSNPVTVYLDEEDITNRASIIRTIYNEEEEEVANIDTSIIQTYTVYFDVQYQGFEKQFTKTIIIE